MGSCGMMMICAFYAQALRRSMKMTYKRRIMIVNDYPEFLEMMAEVLGEEGFEVLTLPKHQGAFEQIKASQPDLVICDLILDAVGAGLALVDMLTLDPQTTSVPVLVCSAATQYIREIAPSLDAKGILWLEKPFTLEQLMAKVNACLISSPRQRQIDGV
jgi:DNA-binding response OmpR family regulator